MVMEDFGKLKAAVCMSWKTFDDISNSRGRSDLGSFCALVGSNGNSRNLCENFVSFNHSVPRTTKVSSFFPLQLFFFFFTSTFLVRTILSDKKHKFFFSLNFHLSEEKYLSTFTS